jgi:hypothetical protein
MGLITEEGEIVDEVTFRMQAAKKEQAKTISQLRASAIVKMADEVERQRTIQLRQKLDHLSKMERVERIKQQRQHPKGVEEDFDPSYPNHHPQHEAYVHHTRPQSSMDILHQRLGVSESEFSLYTRMTKPKVVSLSSPLSPYSTSASHSKPVPPTKPKPLSRSLPTPKRRATFRQPLTSHDTSKLQGQPEVMLQYNGPTVHLGGVGEQRGLTDIVILQQHCGGNTVCVFKGKVKPKGIILFMSRRHRDCPFGLSMYTEGMIDTRLSVCCEYKHKVGRVLGCKGGHFKLIKVTGGKPCYKCQVAEEEESKRKEKEKIRAQMAEQQKLLTAKTNAQTGKEVSVEDSIAASIVTDLRMSTKASPNSVEDTEKIQVKEDPSSTTTHEVGTSEPHTAQEEGTEGKEENYEEEFEDSYSDISTTSSGASSSVQSLRSREETGRRESDHSISSTEDSDIPDSASNGSHGNIHIQNPSDKEDHLSGDGDHHDDIAASDKESHTSQNGSSCHGNNDKDGDNDVGDGKECEDSYRDDHNEPRLSDSPNLSSASSTTESDGFFSSKLERPLSPTFDIHVSVDHENTAGSGRDTQQEVHPHIPKITISTASLSLSDLLDSSDDERDSSEREKGKLEVVNNRATGYCGSGGDSDGVSGGNGDGGDGGGMNKSASSVTQGIDEGLKGTNADGDGNKGKVDDDRDENKADEEDGDGSRADNDTDVHKIEGCVDEHELGSGDSDGGNDDENKVDGDGIARSMMMVTKARLTVMVIARSMMMVTKARLTVMVIARSMMMVTKARLTVMVIARLMMMVTKARMMMVKNLKLMVVMNTLTVV